jgi:hypothetical protein
MNKRLFAIIFLFLLLPFAGKAIIRGRRPHRFPHFKHNYFFFSGHNTLQIEAYLNYENGVLQRSVSYPSFLFRYGVLDVVELRATFDINTTRDQPSINKTGITPLQLGAKFRFNKPDLKRRIPAFTLTAMVTFPRLATESLRQTYWAPQLLLSAEQDISSKLSLEYAAGFQMDPDNFKPSLLASLNSEYDLTDRTSFISDLYFVKQQTDLPDMRLDAGINYMVYKNLWFEFVAGSGLTRNSPDYYLSAGFQWAVRVKKKKINGANSQWQTISP